MKSVLCLILLTSIAYAQKTPEDLQRRGDSTQPVQLPPEKDTHPRLASGTGGAGIDSTYAHLWNEHWVLTFKGRITGINVGPPAKNMTGNTVQILVLSPNGGTSFTHLGPDWYVNQQKTKLHVGDQVTVVGSKIMLDHRGSIMARKVIVNGNDVLLLRDLKGVPFWPNDPGVVLAKKAHVPNPQFTKEDGETHIVHVHVGEFGRTLPIEMKYVTIDGSVYRFDVDRGNVTMVMQVDSQLRKVFLGPEWMIARQEVRIMPGDRITVVMLAPNNLNALAYAEAIYLRNGGVLRFRDKNGAPYSP